MEVEAAYLHKQEVKGDSLAGSGWLEAPDEEDDSLSPAVMSQCGETLKVRCDV
jgi:hypothetical protein